MRTFLLMIGAVGLWAWLRGGDGAPVTPDPDPAKPLRKVAFVVGHNAKAKGAYAPAPMATFEYGWSQKIAHHMRVLGPSYGLQVQTINRQPAGSYAEEIDAAYALIDPENELIGESHFNAGGGDYGIMLHAGSEAGKAMATVFAKELEGLFGWKVRTRKLTRKDRGGRSVLAAKQPTVLLEPGFGDYKSHSARMHQLGPQAIAEAYLRAFAKALEA